MRIEEMERDGMRMGRKERGNKKKNKKKQNKTKIK